MTAEIVHLDPDNLLHEYGLDTQRLQPWSVLNAPFEGSWALAHPHSHSTLHSHHEHEIFIAVRGSATIECDGKQASFRAGDVAFLRPGLEHRLLNDSSEEFMFYSVWWDREMAENFLSRDSHSRDNHSRGSHSRDSHSRDWAGGAPVTRPRPSEDNRPVLVLGPNPTPNGGMHLGHIAGPYLAGDVYARYQRARGREVVFTTGTDDSQTFVVASARRLGTTPEELCATSTSQIRNALSKIGISVDGFGPFDDAYRATVRNYFRSLHAAGKFRLRTVRLPYLERTGEFIVEGLVEGECPVCLATCRGGLCETCCHPNNFFELLNPHSTVDPTDVPVPREATVLVLPMEEYRAELTAYHERWAPYWRPHMVQMVEDVLSRPLADLPITYPLNWGMPAPFPETPGQVLNAWLELIPAGMFTSSYCAARLGRQTSPGQLWLPEERVRIVHFLGFDNAYFFCLAHMALLMAHGDRYVRPEWILTNEFYELESEKFSTSKGHVLSVQELLRDVPRDLARIYLALTAPEYQRTTFSRSGLEKIAEERLVEPWNQLATTLRRALAIRTNDTPLPVSAAGRGRAGTMVDRFDHCYEMPNYSLNRSADTILVHVARLRASARRLEGSRIDDEPEAWGDLFLEISALLALAAPVLIDLGDAARQAGASDGSLSADAFDLTEIRPFVPPLLPAHPAGARNSVSAGAGVG